MVEIIKALQAEIARLKEILNLDSKTRSKPPSQEIIKKPEKKQSTLDTDETELKRKPGGQPGHKGKTRKGFGRVDRTLNPTSIRAVRTVEEDTLQLIQKTSKSNKWRSS